MKILHLAHGKRESFLLGVRCKKGSPWHNTFTVTYVSVPFLPSFVQGRTASRAAEFGTPRPVSPSPVRAIRIRCHRARRWTASSAVPSTEGRRLATARARASPSLPYNWPVNSSRDCGASHGGSRDSVHAVRRTNRREGRSPRSPNVAMQDVSEQPDWGSVPHDSSGIHATRAKARVVIGQRPSGHIAHSGQPIRPWDGRRHEGKLDAFRFAQR